MPEPEWQERVNRLDEVTLVQARIMDRLERKYDGAIQRHDEEMAELRAAQLKTEQSLQILSSGVNSLAETVDRFIKGSKSNGRKN